VPVTSPLIFSSPQIHLLRINSGAIEKVAIQNFPFVRTMCRVVGEAGRIAHNVGAAREPSLQRQVIACFRMRLSAELKPDLKLNNAGIL
jgi:hypothetical protein